MEACLCLFSLFSRPMHRGSAWFLPAACCVFPPLALPVPSNPSLGLQPVLLGERAAANSCHLLPPSSLFTFFSSRFLSPKSAEGWRREAVPRLWCSFTGKIGQKGAMPTLWGDNYKILTSCHFWKGGSCVNSMAEDVFGQELDQAQGRGRGGDAWSWETTNAAEIWKTSWGRKAASWGALSWPRSDVPASDPGH